MNEIIPRWEWRSFAKDLGQAEKNLEKYECTRVLDSAEDYIVTTKGGNNVKVRDGKLDIKELRNINDDTLEQWMPVLKVGFPCKAEEASRIYESFNMDAPVFDKDEFTYDEFIKDVIGGSEDLAVVKVVKKRFGYMLGEVIVELAEVTFDGVAWKTMAVEHTDPELVMSFVKELELNTFENVNYIRAMKRSIGMSEVTA
ncbi:hypothetical protein HN388_05060 [bacterium]|mgnify:FL=1|jgi:exopolyphosphatase/guanosine-5'-triphosphate,3'-diphosphate pyrophosphatase|nr:hypothetical protein [bacterium]MBT4291970.1 hypothetical protein [bacterium]MBT7310266.1 hypothetical protein [bacterium]